MITMMHVKHGLLIFLYELTRVDEFVVFSHNQICVHENCCFFTRVDEQMRVLHFLRRISEMFALLGSICKVLVCV